MFSVLVSELITQEQIAVGTISLVEGVDRVTRHVWPLTKVIQAVTKSRDVSAGRTL